MSFLEKELDLGPRAQGVSNLGYGDPRDIQLLRGNL